MIVYVLEFDKTRIEFATEEAANQYKIDNGIDSEVTPFEKVEEVEIWSKDKYEQELNVAHDLWFESKYKPLDYKSVQEIGLWVNNPEYGEEATSLLNLYWDSWELLKAHLIFVTEQTANVEAFINSLPNE